MAVANWPDTGSCTDGGGRVGDVPTDEDLVMRDGLGASCFHTAHACRPNRILSTPGRERPHRPQGDTVAVAESTTSWRERALAWVKIQNRQWLSKKMHRVEALKTLMRLGHQLRACAADEG